MAIETKAGLFHFDQTSQLKLMIIKQVQFDNFPLTNAFTNLMMINLVFKLL